MYVSSYFRSLGKKKQREKTRAEIEAKKGQKNRDQNVWESNATTSSMTTTVNNISFDDIHFI